MAGATRTGSLNILRTLYRELRPTVNAPQQHVYQTQLWRHIVGLCRNCKSTPSANAAEVHRNLEDTGRSYVFYLQSNKEYHRISEEYRGAGERTADDTARMLGFKMPNEERDPPKQRASSRDSDISNNRKETKFVSSSDKLYSSSESVL